MYFNTDGQEYNFVSTRDLDLNTEDFTGALLEEDFESSLQG